MFVAAMVFEKGSLAEIKSVWLKKVQAYPKLQKRLVKFLGVFYWQTIPDHKFK